MTLSLYPNTHLSSFSSHFFFLYLPLTASLALLLFSISLCSFSLPYLFLYLPPPSRQNASLFFLSPFTPSLSRLFFYISLPPFLPYLFYLTLPTRCSPIPFSNSIYQAISRHFSLSLYPPFLSLSSISPSTPSAHPPF